MAERQFTLPPLPPRHIISYDLDNGHLRDQDYQRLERDLTGLGRNACPAVAMGRPYPEYNGGRPTQYSHHPALVRNR